MKPSYAWIRTGVLAGLLAVTGCWHKDGPGPAVVATPKSQLQARHFESCSDYRQYYSAALTRELLEGGACWGCERLEAGGAPPLAANDGPAAPGAVSGPGGFRDVSGTNTQEAGVDEADLLKADARGYFYLARGPELLVIRATPADQLSVAHRMTLRSSGYGHARSLYLDAENQRLVVLIDGAGPHYPAAEPGPGPNPAPMRYGTGLLFLDVSNPVEPVATDWHWTEGYLFDSRRVDQRLHLVSSHHFWWPSILSRDGEFQQRLQAYHRARFEKREADAEALARRIRQDVAAAVAETPLAELLPLRRSGLGAGAPQPLACEAVLHPQVEQRLGLLLITSINTDGSAPAALGTLNNAWQVYASREHLYLAQHSGGWWFDRRQRAQTAVYRFALTDQAVVPAGMGVVDGWTRDSYSFGEHEGFLRLATTENQVTVEGEWTATNHLFVLGPGSDGDLGTVGEVRDFILDERIFSARFLGDRGFVVTFRQVDPLFAFDLSDPRAPRLAGQVEIPGFSTYIHPLGPDHLLTIGRDGDDNGINHNIRLQIFDVSDLAAPSLAHVFVPDVDPDDWVFSLAEFDPHAFTYYAPARLLSIPIQVGSPNAGRSFSGFLALGADAQAGFGASSWIDHKVADGGGSGCPDSAGGNDAPCSTFAPVRYHWPLRSVVGVEDERTVLFTLSSAMLQSADLTDLSLQLDRLELAPP